MRVPFHIILVVVLTVLTQLGGLAWLVALGFRRRFFSFVLIYAGLSLSAVFVAPMFGRVALPCTAAGALQMQSLMYCALNRQYVTPEMADVLDDLAADMAQSHAGTVTQVLDANFPFFTGFPLLPHLSHDDGHKVDIAFYYRDDTGYLAGQTRSPIGYFAFEQGPTSCPKRWPTLRWDMGWLQGLWPRMRPDPARMRAALGWLSSEPRIGKVFIEPHLKVRFGQMSPKIRFQGCRAARHDDHIHIQL